MTLYFVKFEQYIYIYLISFQSVLVDIFKDIQDSLKQ